MVWFSKKKSTDEARSNDQALALQDPRTRVHTTSAATSTTNTAVQNSTIIDNNKNTVTYMSTRQTVTHTQQARVTEMTTRRTPSQKELDELFAQMAMNGGGTTKTTSTTTSSKRTSPSSLYGVALRSTPSFKASSEARRSSTLVKTEQVSVSQKQGRSVTQHVETQRVVFNPPGTSKPTWPPAPNPTTTKSASSTSLTLKPLDRSYVSPYGNKSASVSSNSIFTKPTLSTPKTTVTSSIWPTASTPKTTVNSSVRPTLSTPKTTVTSSIWTPKTTVNSSVKPTLATSKVTTPKPFISLNPSQGAVPKRSSISSVSSRDAQGELKPSSLITRSTLSSVSKKKLKPAEVVIFNHEKFDNQNEFRVGSAEDVKALEKTFKALKCNVKIIPNATLDEVRSNVRKLEQKNFSDRSALVLVMLSHGQRYDTLAARDGDYKLDDDIIFPIVRNRTLQDKPKILFVQACKGSREIGAFKTDSAQPHGVPSEILKCYSTYEGYVSYRHDDGTPFIRSLCDTLKAKPHVDIATIMEEVRCLVKTYTQDAQIPTVTTTLTTKYVFGDYT
ncbi:mucin-3A [Drosophila innubila]|uniref:mucin-3A n=1 Tax=Drosophila innubila TaxID=198719 RepID=UPI00148D35C0|nr:mucin-3A [Drosophila innubila]